MTKILVVEDDIYLLKLYQEILQQEGYLVEIAEDGREGLEKAQQFMPDLILLDIMLPYMDGFEVLTKLKSIESTKNIKVLILTNLDSQKQKEKALSLGADKFIVKVGNDPSMITAIVKEVTEG